MRVAGDHVSRFRANLAFRTVGTQRGHTGTGWVVGVCGSECSFRLASLWPHCQQTLQGFRRPSSFSRRQMAASEIHQVCVVKRDAVVPKWKAHFTHRPPSPFTHPPQSQFFGKTNSYLGDLIPSGGSTRKRRKRSLSNNKKFIHT